VLVRDPGRAGDLEDRGATLCVGDLGDVDSLRRGMRGSDGVFHIAGWYETGIRNGSLGERINVEGTRNVLQVMKELAVPRGVYTSSLAVNSDTHGQIVDETYRYEGPHLSEYDRTKWVAHHRVAEPMIEEGLPLIIVMPGAVYGPGDRSVIAQTFSRYLQGNLPMIPKKTAVTWAHVDDIADAHILAMEKGRIGETYIIAGPPHSVEEAFEIAAGITGIPAPKLRIPPWLMRILAGITSAAIRIIPLPRLYHPENLRITAGVTYWGSNEKARSELGYNPRPLEEGLRQTLTRSRA
jgi:nucleoside-diphosphate-sugar epimerase